MYSILLERSAEKDLKKLSRDAHDQVIVAIQQLARNPRPPGCRKLAVGDTDWRIRVGDFRVIYEIEDAAQLIRVNPVRHRREAYR